MKNDVWEKAERIFHAALEMTTNDRSSYLRRECADNDALFSEVKSLLKSFEENSDFLNEPIFEKGLEVIEANNAKPEKNLSGSVIGYYELQEKIGAGGMGEVYKAVDTRLNRRVALKFLSESLKNDHSAKRRFLKEAQAVAMLEHPNICAVHGIEQLNDYHFIVMQYIAGKTLAESINSESVTAERFKSLARQIIGAVSFAHSHGIIHRDLKPGNIMLTEDGRIKVLDFGLAKIIPRKQILGDDSTEGISQFSQNGLVIGTVSYMSPEQLRGEKLDYRTDIFSLGIILYEILFRKNPFHRKSQAETIAAILSDQSVSLEKNIPVSNDNLIRLVEKCLQKDKEKRFQSAAEMLIELDKTEYTNSRLSISKHRKSYLVKAAFTFFVLLAIWAGIFFYFEKPQQKTLAVLPISFDNPLNKKEYLTDDLTKSIIVKLSKVPNLKVKNEYSVEHYKDHSTNLKNIGEQLNADAVFSGTIQNRADGLVLETEIIRTSDGIQIDSYELKIDEKNLTGVPEEIVSRILNKIELKLTNYDKNKLNKKDTENNQAKSFYLEGRRYLKQRKESDALEKAVEAFTNAKDIDQKYAKAWAGLGEAYLLQSAPGVKRAITPQRAVELAKIAANKAIELDDSLSDAYNTLGLISARYDWNWRAAEDYFRAAIEQDPEFLPAYLGLISVLNINKRYEEAFKEAEKAKEIDPLSSLPDTQVALIYYQEGNYVQMDKMMSDLLQRFPKDRRLKYVRVYQFLKTEKFKEAVDILEPVYKSNNEEDKVLAAAPLGFAYAKLGQSQKALKVISDLEEFKKNNDNFVPAQEKALIYVGLRDYNKVFENLNLSCAERFASLPNWITDPIVDEVKSDSRFAGIRKCVNL